MIYVDKSISIHMVFSELRLVLEYSNRNEGHIDVFFMKIPHHFGNELRNMQVLALFELDWN